MTLEVTRTQFSAVVSLRCVPLPDTSVRVEAEVHPAREGDGKSVVATPAYTVLSIYGRFSGFSPDEFRTLLHAAQTVLEKAESELARVQRSEIPESFLRAQPGPRKPARKPKARR